MLNEGFILTSGFIVLGWTCSSTEELNLHVAYQHSPFGSPFIAYNTRTLKQTVAIRYKANYFPVITAEQDADISTDRGDGPEMLRSFHILCRAGSEWECV
jgi:hypothetical protein